MTPRAFDGSGDGAGNKSVAKSAMSQEVVMQQIRLRILDLFLMLQNTEGFNRRVFADALGLTTTRLSRIMSGKRDPTVYELHTIAQVSGATMGWLVGGEGDPPPGVRVIKP